MPSDPSNRVFPAVRRGMGMVACALLILLATCQIDKLTTSPPPIASLSVAPMRVLDSSVVANALALADTLSVTNPGQGTLSWTATPVTGAAWLSVTPTSGTAPARVVIRVDPAGLAVGSYRDTLVVSAQNAAGSPARVPVELVVHPCPVAAITLDAQLTDSLTPGGCPAPHRQGSLARLYGFTAQAGDSVSIVMSSVPLDAYLVLSSGADGTGTPVAQSDACDASRSACLRYQRLPATGAYTVEATSGPAGQTGIYTLSVSRPRSPARPDSLAQLRGDSVAAIPLGGTTAEATVVVRGFASDPDAGDMLRLQVEARPVGTAFTNVPTATGDPVPNGTGAWVAATGLADATGYHWQARTLDQTGRAGPWRAYGGNAETAADFTTAIPEPPAPPTALGQFQSDGVAAIPTGGSASDRSVVLRGTVSDPNAGDAVRLDVEVKPIGTAFDGAPSSSSPAVANGAVARATVAGLADNTAYHWQARTADNTGRVSGWVAFGGNAETEPDFTVPAPPPTTGDVRITAATTGSDLDPDGYTVSVDGSTRSIGVNGNVTYAGLATGDHQVALSGVAGNCSVSGSNPRTVTVSAGGTAQTTFSVSCVAPPPPPNHPPSVNAGGDQQVAVGLLFSLSGASFSDPDHDGPWTVTINWGDGSSDTQTASSEGGISATHSYITILPATYTLTITVEDSHGARGSNSKQVSVVTL